MTTGVPDTRVPNALNCARGVFLRGVEKRRLRLYRCVLQASVRSASPLALTFASRTGLALDDILQVMSPPVFWPQSTGSLALPQVRWEVPTRHAWRGGGDDRMMWRVARAGGHAMHIGGDGDWIGWRVSGDTVEVAGRLGSATLVTNRGTLRLWIPHPLPATLCLAMPGRPLAALVQHPYLAGDDLKVVSVDDHRGGGHVLRVRAPKRPFAAPWPALLANLLLTHAEPSLASIYRREA